jgi:lysophospholipase L1-like esterase
LYEYPIYVLQAKGSAAFANLSQNTSSNVFQNTTLRQSIHISLGGSQIRLRLSNLESPRDLAIAAVTVALPYEGEMGVSRIQPATLKTVIFSNAASIDIPPGALAVSDPIDIPVLTDSALTITIYFANGQAGHDIAMHLASHTTSWLTLGNRVSAENISDDTAISLDHWYVLQNSILKNVVNRERYVISGVEVLAPLSSRTLLAIGDSITDGTGSTTNGNDRHVILISYINHKLYLTNCYFCRWLDQLFARMQGDTRTEGIAVANQGIGGNRVLRESTGPNVLGRISRDVFDQDGIRYVMLFAGINDIRQTTSTEDLQQNTADRLIWAYQQIASRVHARGLLCFAATLTPNNGSSGWTDLKETARQNINLWLRATDKFDAIIDFDQILQNPDNPLALLPSYDSGDHLHPSVAGYQAIANAFPLSIF